MEAEGEQITTEFLDINRHMRGGRGEMSARKPRTDSVGKSRPGRRAERERIAGGDDSGGDDGGGVKLGVASSAFAHKPRGCLRMGDASTPASVHVNAGAAKLVPAKLSSRIRRRPGGSGGTTATSSGALGICDGFSSRATPASPSHESRSTSGAAGGGGLMC